jgi:hypothetical protein
MIKAKEIEKSCFQRWIFWYENLENVAMSKPPSLIEYNDKKYVVEHVKNYDDIGCYYDPDYFVDKPKGYYLAIVKRNFLLLIKKIVSTVTRIIFSQKVKDLKENVISLGNETAIKGILTAVINEDFVKDDKIVKKLKKAYDEAWNQYDNIEGKESENPLKKEASEIFDKKTNEYKDGERRAVENQKKKIKNMTTLKLVEFLEGKKSKKFFEFNGFLNVTEKFYSKEIPPIINRFTDIKNLKLYHQIIPKIQKNAFEGLKNLEYLNVSHAHTRFIEDGAFNSLEKLKDLEISYLIKFKTISKTLREELNALENLEDCFIGEGEYSENKIVVKGKYSKFKLKR